MPEHNLEPPRFSRRSLERLLMDWLAVKSMLMTGHKDAAVAAQSPLGGSSSATAAVGPLAITCNAKRKGNAHTMPTTYKRTDHYEHCECRRCLIHDRDTARKWRAGQVLDSGSRRARARRLRAVLPGGRVRSGRCLRAGHRVQQRARLERCLDDHRGVEVWALPGRADGLGLDVLRERHRAGVVEGGDAEDAGVEVRGAVAEVGSERDGGEVRHAPSLDTPR